MEISIGFAHEHDPGSRIPLTIFMGHRYMKIRAEEKERRVCFGSGTQEVF
jgi:hypothetical protein